MEPQQQHPHHQNQNQQQPNEDNSGGAKGNFLCRQTSTRWTPTTDQIRILKEMYYNKGVRSPNGHEIQQISARLRKYGKIEGKNVFYWFQNHKARERQKKRFNNDVSMQQRSSSTVSNWKPEDYSSYKYANNSNPAGFSSSGVVIAGQMDSYGYGSVTKQEQNFWDCSGPTGSNNGGGSWVGLHDPYGSPYTVFDQDQEAAAAEIETLPLFPLHGDQDSNNTSSFNINHQNHPADFYNRSSWYGSNDYGNDTSRTSLELSLYSYSTGQPQPQDY